MTQQQAIIYLNLGAALGIAITIMSFAWIVALITARHNPKLKIPRITLKGKHKFYLSIWARIICAVGFFMVLIIINWKFIFAIAFFVTYRIIDEEWKNYGH